MKVTLFKRDNGEVYFAFDGNETEYTFNENGVFKYIDSIIENNYVQIDIDYDKSNNDLAEYSTLFNEIFNEMIKPENKFKEAYEKTKELETKADDSEKAVNQALNPNENENN